MPRLFVGAIVHYVAYNGVCLAGIVIGIDDDTDTVDLVIFTNLANVNGVKNYGMQFHTAIAYAHSDFEDKAGHKPGTWHFAS